MWEMDHKEGWMLKNWCFWTVVGAKILESPLDCKEIESVNSKGNQSWISIEGLMLRLKFQYSGHLMRRADSLEKTLMLGKTEGRREDKGTTEDEMVWWHHWLYGHEFEHVPGIGEGQGSLACCSPWVAKSQTRLSNWTTTTTAQSVGLVFLACELLWPISESQEMTFSFL